MAVIIWGVDLGVRSFHAAGIDKSGDLQVFSKVLKPTKLVRDQASYERAMELRTLRESLYELVKPDDTLYIEEPPLAGPKNVRVYGKLHQVCGVLASATEAQTHLIPVDTWKMSVVGKGGSSKDVVKSYLETHFSAYSLLCDGDQNLIDATCIALYGYYHTF